MKKKILIISMLFLYVFRVQDVSAQVTPSTTIALNPIPTPTIVPPVLPINLTLSPVSLDFDTKPGTSQTAEIRIRNNSSETEHLQASFGSFAFNQRTGDIDLSQDIVGQDRDWISINEPTFEIEPLEWKTLKITFSPPQDAALTHYYAVIFSRIVSAQSQGETTKVSGAPAVLVLSNVDSPLGKRELQIDQFFAKRFWVEFLPELFTLKIKNTGNIHLAPSGNIFIDGPGQKDLAVLSINPKNSVILPNSSRDFIIQWDDGTPKFVDKMEKTQPVLDKDGKVVQQLSWDDLQLKKFRIGRYTAHLLLVYDNGERDVPIESSISFWVIPWRMLLVLLVISLLVFMGLILLYIVIRKVLLKKKVINNSVQSI